MTQKQRMPKLLKTSKGQTKPETPKHLRCRAPPLDSMTVCFQALLWHKSSQLELYQNSEVRNLYINARKFFMFLPCMIQQLTHTSEHPSFSFIISHISKWLGLTQWPVSHLLHMEQLFQIYTTCHKGLKIPDPNPTIQLSCEAQY